MITRDALLAIMPNARSRIDHFLTPLNEAMAEYAIDTPKRQAAFLAQIAHESGELRYVREIASGAAYDTGRLAERLGNTPEADGDGQRYKGRGLIQITGKDNYRECSNALGVDLLSHPERLEEPELACRSAAWFWHSHDLNTLADTGKFKSITRAINGGYNGLVEREKYYLRAIKALGVVFA